MPHLSGCTPSTTIAQCLERGWALAFRCSVCTRRARWTLSEVAALPGEATLHELAARARCGVCGAAEGIISTVNGHWHPGAEHGGVR